MKATRSKLRSMVAPTVFALLVAGRSWSATVTTLYSFGPPNAPALPNTEVTLYHGWLYGASQASCGKNACHGPGTEFRLSLASVKLQTIKGVLDEENAPPGGALVETGGTLYGVTQSEGGYGTIFKVNPLTHVATVLYSFTGGADGGHPGQGLAAVGSLLYGVTQDGPTGSTGTLFQFDPSSNAITTLHAFTAAEGSTPESRLVTVEGVLYGTAPAGGAYGQGTIFGFNVNTRNLSTTYSFDTGGNVGNMPQPWLAATGNRVFGVAYSGKKSEGETIFSLDLSSGKIAALVHFPCGANGYCPNGELVAEGNALYGTTSRGGANSLGAVFKLDISSRLLTTLYSFTGSGSDGSLPDAGMTYYDHAFYGTTYSDGARHEGIIYKLTP